MTTMRVPSSYSHKGCPVTGNKGALRNYSQGALSKSRSLLIAHKGEVSPDSSPRSLLVLGLKKILSGLNL
jgi:hypothetical protein